MMQARILLVQVILAAAVFGSGGFGREVLGAQPGKFTATVCETPGDAPLAASSTIAAGLPPALNLAVLAENPAAQWPEFAHSLVLTMRALTFDPGTASEMRRAQGPMLFYVAAGEVGISVNGKMASHAAGSAVLIETHQNYLIRNGMGEPAGVLRLALVPPEEETTVGTGGLAQVVDGSGEIASVGSTGSLASELLVSADIPAIGSTMNLFLACLGWADPAADPGAASQPGPIGFLVLDGQLLVGESGQLGAGQCTIFQPEATRWLRAGDPPPVVLVFGAVPEGSGFWGPAPAEGASPPPALASFQCGEDSSEDEAPVAASALPGARLTPIRL